MVNLHVKTFIINSDISLFRFRLVFHICLAAVRFGLYDFRNDYLVMFGPAMMVLPATATRLPCIMDNYHGFSHILGTEPFFPSH